MPKRLSDEERKARRKASRDKYRSSEEYLAVNRAYRKARFEAMSPEEKEHYLAKRRESTKRLTPSQKEAISATLKRNYERRKASGICVACTELAVTKLHCLAHWFDNIGRPYGLTKKNGGAETLEVLWREQDGKCALTGEVLIPGVNATIDHKLPQSRGGTHARSNLQWVTRSVNNSKYDLTNEEFLELCRKVLHCCGESNVVSLRRMG